MSDDPVVPPPAVVPDQVLDELRGAFASGTAEPPSDETVTVDDRATEPVSKVIQIGGDDLPDVAFLDEEGEDRLRSTHDGSRGTILIGDADDGALLDRDEDGEADDAPLTGAVPMDPRVRSRRIGVARAEGRRRLLRASVAAAIVLALIAVFGVLASSLFRVGNVEIQGAVYTDPAELAAIEDDLRGEPLLLVDSRAIERQLEQLAWVELAQVGKDFPNTVRIDLRERRPVITFVGSDARWRVADRDGRVLAVLDGQPAAPMLVAGVGPDTEVAQFAGSGRSRLRR
jgi:POTRA domain, FtsQ-type